MGRKAQKQRKSEEGRKRARKRKRENEHSDFWVGLEKAFSKYNQNELIATLGGLQVLQENHTHLVRLEIASRVACSIQNGGNQNLDIGKIISILNQHLPRDGPVGRMEDPIDNLFTDNIVFYGGNYIIYPGIEENGVFILRTFLDAIFGYGEGLSDEFKYLINPSVIALMYLSNEVANRLGHTRYMESPDTWRKNFVTPKREIFYKASDAVRFSLREIKLWFKKQNIDHRFLSPFITTIANTEFKNKTPYKNLLFVKPLLHIGSELILVQPGSVCTALRHFVLVTAKHMNLVDALSANYRKAENNKINRHCSIVTGTAVSRSFHCEAWL